MNGATKLYGVWIDHEKALIVQTNEVGEEMQVKELVSELEPHSKAGRSDGEHLTMTDQRSHNESRGQEMKDFCKSILGELRDADEIVIFGPGNAKENLKNCIEGDHDLAPKLKAVETTHPLSEKELEAKVRELFSLPRG